MSIARDVYYGHEGDLEFWEDLSKPGVGDWLVNKTINAVFGADFEQERTFVIDGVVYSESTYNDVDFSIGLFAELLVENDSIWIDITAFNFNADRDWGAQTQAFNQASSDIYNRIKIDGQSLSDLIIEQEAK